MAPPLRMTQQYRFASLAAWLSSTGISPVNSSLTSPQSISLQSTAALALGLLSPQTPAPSHCALQGTCIPAWHVDGCSTDCLGLSPFRLPQISCLTLSLKCFSSDSDDCPDVGIRPLLQFPHLLRAGPVLLTSLFFPLVPSSYQVLHGSTYPFPLVRYSCLLSTGVLHALLCLRCVPDVSMERDVLHVHQLLCHLVL